MRKDFSMTMILDCRKHIGGSLSHEPLLHVSSLFPLTVKPLLQENVTIAPWSRLSCLYNLSPFWGGCTSGQDAVKKQTNRI